MKTIIYKLRGDSYECVAINQSGEKLGVLKDVIHPARTDIYVITTPNGEAMVPVVEEFVKRADEEGIFLSPIEGMFA